MTRCVLASGDIVVATLSKPSTLASLASQYGPNRLVTVAVDVTVQSDIAGAFTTAAEQFGRVDVVVSNAGVSVLGEVEGTPDDPARSMFEVNFWGAAHISQEAVRFFRDENVPCGGHLVQNSAGTGMIGFPILSFYAAAKHGEFCGG